ncbi:protease-4 [Salsuginibacillus halophilus]|uniref:Protease-4 n=1 Tax=Salsuginibacillus halophilus TaxID=517424 RepID=A0A2P8HBM2_9BACI|nr:signal peptide peptidase SppA [Salsuginibacillus halophilus]PSL43628.1 protease-4 [Salsuginibacillus halophilus]
MNAKRWWALGIAALVLVVGIGFQMVATTAATFMDFGDDDDDDGFQESRVDEMGGPGKIAVLDVDGVIMDMGTPGLLDAGGYNHEQFLRAMDRAMADESVDGIMLDVNTPGGGVVESAEIHEKIVEAREEYETPVHVSMGGQAASGGYYIAAAADTITAHPATITGSIGVIMESINIADLAEDLGFEIETITSGENKDIMNPTEQLTEEQEAILQSMVDDMYEDFVQVVDEGRDLSEEEVRNLADGRIFTGNQAYDEGLVDELGTRGDALEQMREDLEMPQAEAVRYEQGIGFQSLFELGARQLAGDDIRLSLLRELTADNDLPRLMYMYNGE